MVQVNGNAPESTIYLSYKTTKLALEAAIEVGITIKVGTTIKAVGMEEAATEIDEMEEVEEAVIAGEIHEVIATQIAGEIPPPIMVVVVVDLIGHLEDIISNLHRHGLDVVVAVIAAVVEDGEIKITHQMEVRLIIFICSHLIY